MFTETDADAPRTAVEHGSERDRAEDFTNEWLDRVEVAVERAHAMLLTPLRSGVPQFTDEMEWAWRERSYLAANPAMAPRLTALSLRLNLVRRMLRQAAALEQAREQLKTESVLGYTPVGLELALR